MKTVEPFSARPAQAAGQEDKREPANPADSPVSFRASMQEAEQKAAKTEHAEQKGIELEQIQQNGEVPPSLKEGVRAMVEQVRANEPAAAAPQGEIEAIEDLLPLAQKEEEQPGEDVPAENEAQMAILAALLMQPGIETQAELPEETEHPALEGRQIVRTDPLPVQHAAAQWQAAVPQEGERELPRTEEPIIAQGDAPIPEYENTLPEETPRPVATMAQATERQPRERDMSPTPAGPRRDLPAFGPATETPRPVADLRTIGGEPLPAPEAGRILADSLFEQVQSAVSTGRQELFVQLKPESLGGLVIHLSMTEEGIKAQVRASSENIQHLVTGQIAQLEDALRARDIPVVQLDVVYDQSAGNGFLGQHRQSWQESGGWGRGNFMVPMEETAGLYEAALAAAPAVDAGDEGVVYSA